MRRLCKVASLLKPLVLTDAPADAAVVITPHVNAFGVLEEDTTGDKVEGLVAAHTRRKEVARAAAGGAGKELTANKGAGQLLAGLVPYHRVLRVARCNAERASAHLHPDKPAGRPAGHVHWRVPLLLPWLTEH